MSSSAARSQSSTLLVGLSGPSSAGKTTLARLLRAIFNIPASASTHNRSITLFILHEDDFYKADNQIPIVTVSSAAHGTRELQDWDCAESLDLPLFESTLRYVKQHGALPPAAFSKEDQNSVGDSGVADTTIAQCQERVKTWLASLPDPNPDEPRHLTICILDGFLLYPAPTAEPSIPAAVTGLLDLKLFLRGTHALTKARREARAGYVTLEGFWTDPPGYVDEVVWPNYVREHGWMFEGGDVDGGAVEEEAAVQREAVVIGPGLGEREMRELLFWGIVQLKEQLRRVFKADA